MAQQFGKNGEINIEEDFIKLNKENSGTKKLSKKGITSIEEIRSYNPAGSMPTSGILFYLSGISGVFTIRAAQLNHSQVFLFSSITTIIIVFFLLATLLVEHIFGGEVYEYQIYSNKSDTPIQITVSKDEKSEFEDAVNSFATINTNE